ncbi:sodium-coupled neutral amino acid symporter 1-like isoform X1 [Heterodontus francisci]|uniref:sodium-coupled neutral amino acid symporter 1-like isoform X1 n=1 Tax=Heterodontus francisci TaxID=7792 RepID=UPI00355ACE1B
MAARPGQRMSAKSDVSTHSIFTASGESLASGGRTVSPTQKSSRRPTSPAYTPLLSQRRLRWLGHVCRMEDGRIPKDALYSELATGIRPTGHPCLHFKDICKHDMKSCNIDHKSWESLASDCQSWRTAIKAGLKSGCLVYETLGQQAFGKPGKFAVFGSTSLQNVGAILSYLFIVKNELPKVIQSFTDQDNSEVWYLDDRNLVICVTVIIILPLCLFKNLGYLGYTSGFSLACMTFFLIVVIYKKTQLSCPLVSTNVSNNSCTSMCAPKYFLWNEKTVYALPTVAFAFVCHPSVLPIYSELKNRTCRKMHFVSAVSFVSMFIMYLLTAVFGYLTFYGSVNEELLLSYPDHHDKVILLIRLAVIISVVLTVPVLLFTIRSSIVLLVFKGKFSWTYHILITGFLLAASNLLVINIPTIKDVFAVIGSTSANMLIFILPASLYLKLVNNESQKSWQKIVAVAFLAVGIMFMCITVPLIFIEWNQRSGNHTMVDSCCK